MLKKERQIKFLKKRMEAVAFYAKEFCTSQKQEALHDLRVEIKKIRAMLRFSSAFSGMEVLQLDIERLLEMFKHAGKIREAHIILELTNNYQYQPNELKQLQQQNITDLSAAFIERSDMYINYLEDTYLPLTTYFTDVKTKAIVGWFEEKIKKLVKYFKGKLKEDKLHKQRKKLKQLLYINEILPPSIQKKVNLDTDYLDEMQHLIGKWHDDLDAKKFLETHRTEPEKTEALIDAMNKKLKGIEEMANNFSRKIYR